jgi:cytochrome c
MDNRQNIIAMMGLGAMIVALGGTIVFGEVFEEGRPEKMGYVVEGVEEAGGDTGAVKDISIASLLPTADVEKGKAVFAKCAACHTIEQGGANGIGPNLWASFGKPHGHVAGFAYSDALKGVPGNWDFDGMNKWLHSPKTYAPGTKMTFAGLSKNEDRANLIAYLNSMGSNVPVPPAPAPGAAPAEGEAAANATAANAAAPADNAAAPAAK